MGQIAITEVGFESATVQYQTFLDWGAAFAGVKLTPVKGLLEPLRMVKTPNEIEAIRKACALTDACFDHVLRLIQPGVAEYDIMLEIEFYFRRNGAGLAFAPIVVSGPNSARPHGTATERQLQRGDFVTMDFGAKLNGYCADLTRTVVVEEASPRHREIYDQVLKANVECINAIKPGVSCRDVDQLARTILDEKDLGQYFGHGLGHGLGRDVHDIGGLNSRSTDVIAPGQVWTVEPGVYIEGFGGVRIEDDVVVTETGTEVLNHSDKGLLILPQRS
jgi:Xaa-Pro aminopeptidase